MLAISNQIYTQTKKSIDYPTFIRDKYDYIESSQGKYARVFNGSMSKHRANYPKKGKWGIIDTNGNEKISCKFDYLSIAYSNILLVYKGKTNKNGYPNVKKKNGYYKTIGGSYSFLNLSDTTDLNFIYQEIKTCKQDFSIVKLNNEYVVLDSNKNILIQDNYDDIRLIHGNNFSVKKDDKYFFINQQGEKRNLNKYDGLYFMDKGYTAFRKEKLWGFLDTNFNEIIEPKYEEFISSIPYGPLMTSHIKAKKEGKYGLINISDSVIIPFKYDNLYKSYAAFKLTVVELNNKFGLLDSMNNLAIPIVYDYIEIINPNNILLYKGRTKGRYRRPKIGGLKSIYDLNKKEVVKNDILEAFVTHGEVIAFHQKKKGWGFFDLHGNELIKPKYTSINRLGFKNGITNVKLQDKWVQIDKEGNVVNTDENLD